MAIDLLVMPLSRYFSGDYMTPAMRVFWQAGKPYAVIGPKGRRELAPGQPFGGPDAPSQRAHLLQKLIPDVFQKLAAETTDSPWDDHSDAEPCFHRPSNEGFAALMKEAVLRSRPGKWPWSRKPASSHLARAAIHVPVRFATPLAVADKIIGSLPMLESELTSQEWPDAAADAVERLEAAIADATRLRLPLIVDM